MTECLKKSPHHLIRTQELPAQEFHIHKATGQHYKHLRGFTVDSQDKETRTTDGFFLQLASLYNAMVTERGTFSDIMSYKLKFLKSKDTNLHSIHNILGRTVMNQSGDLPLFQKGVSTLKIIEVTYSGYKNKCYLCGC